MRKIPRYLKLNDNKMVTKIKVLNDIKENLSKMKLCFLQTMKF